MTDNIIDKDLQNLAQKVQLKKQLKETAMGGIATTPAGQAIYKEIFG